MPGGKKRSGAESLVEIFVASGVDVCFANPGTSEMHFVAALDSNPEMRCVLGLFEGVVTGAADGYGRMARKPAATLTHLGPGLGNGLANLHNAKKARTPVVNVIGDHATYHRKYDAPLTSDVEGVARPMSNWIRVSQTADSVGHDGAEAVQAALSPPGQIASLILPADTAWSITSAVANPREPLKPKSVDHQKVMEVAKILKSDPNAVFLINGFLSEDRMSQLGKISKKTGAKIISDTFVARTERGAGRVEAQRLPYFGEQASQVLAGTKNLVLISSQPPVTFFAYPDKPNWLTPKGCETYELIERDGDIDGALDGLCQELEVGSEKPLLVGFDRPDKPKGVLDPMTIGQSLGHYFPDNAIVVDEGGMSGAGASISTRTAAPHDWLMLTGGSIGYGMPAATGAAIACPDRRVINLQADGSAMYTIQSLWTQAREGLDITTIIFSNRKYAILQVEFARVGAHNPGPKAMSMLDLTNPDLGWLDLAKGLGVNAWRATTADEFNSALAASLATPGPSLIEAVI